MLHVGFYPIVLDVVVSGIAVVQHRAQTELAILKASLEREFSEKEAQVLCSGITVTSKSPTPAHVRGSSESGNIC